MDRSNRSMFGKVFQWFRSTPRSRPARRGLQLEALEGRQFLAATDMIAFAGRVFRDTNGNGYTAGEEVAGAQVRLFRDANANNSFDSGSDTLLLTTTTNGTGQYRFDTSVGTPLTAGTYFVQQPAQTVGANNLAADVSAPIVVSAVQVMGTAGTVIDTFNTTADLASAVSTGPTSATSATAAPEAIGGERDFSVSVTSGIGMVELRGNAFGAGVLEYSATATANGTRIVTWDGVDGAGGTLNGTGLGGIDLTSAGASTGISLTIGADQNNGQVILRIYTNAGNFSTATVNIPNTGGAATQTVIVPFTSFTVGGGTGATLTNVGAIQMEVSGILAVDGQVDTLGAIGPTLFAEDFDNAQPTADLMLQKSVNTPTPNVGQNVTFTITLTNQGPLGATGVAVSDVLPSGLTFVTALASQGSYNNSNGLWTVGNVANGANATLQITATVATVGTKTNTAQVSASDQFDIDSTPGNNNAQEDDQASAAVTPPAVDLSVLKSVSNSAPNIGQNVTFTVTVSNAGPNNATNVTLADQLPAGLTFVSSTPSQGTYDSTSGVWTVGTINTGANATLQIVVTVATGGTKLNTAQVRSVDQFDVDSTPNNSVATEDDQASAPLTPPTIDLSLQKSVNNTAPQVGQNVVFTVILTNNGPSNGTGIAVTDVLPTGMTFVSSTPTQGTYNSTTGLWTVGGLNAGAMVTLNITATVATGGNKTNTAQVSAADQFDIDSTPANSLTAEDDQSAVTLTPPRRLTKRRFLARG